MLNALQMSHQLMTKLISKYPQGNFIDATLGNGGDSSYILDHDNFQGQLFAFDIQEQAIIKSQERLKEHQKFNQLTILHQSHHHIVDSLAHIEEFHGAIYNLGYLPGADHQITTQGQTTIQSIQQVLDKLILNGQILIVVYWGHEEGKVEKEEIFAYLQTLEQANFQVASYQFINQQNYPPILLVVERIN